MSRILLIDDDEFLRGLLLRSLQSAGFEVRCAGNGKEGLRLFQAERPDLVITDLIMPEKEGLETIVEMRQTNPQIKIIAISHPGAHNFLEIALHFGAAKIFEKPFEFSEVVAAAKELTEP